jgi:hypothetical protein
MAFEYKSLSHGVSERQLDDVLNDHAREGWEFVSMSEAFWERDDKEMHRTVVFRRPTSRSVHIAVVWWSEDSHEMQKPVLKIRELLNEGYRIECATPRLTMSDPESPAVPNAETQGFYVILSK